MSTEYLWVIGIVVVYLWLCWYCLLRGRKPLNINFPGSTGGNELLIAYASQGGQAEDLARRYAELLQQRHNVSVLSLNQIHPAVLQKSSLALFIVSTYGEGEPPDNALRFYQQWLRQPADDGLKHLHFAVLALGDKQYRNFCSFGTSLATHLVKHGAELIFQPITVDDLNAEHLAHWQQQLLSHGLLENNDIVSPAKEKKFSDGVLIRQECANNGSPGDPAYHLGITPLDALHWQAGDIVEIQFENPTETYLREYSIASIPEDKCLELLVRRVCKTDGSYGQGSGWLTYTASIGSTLKMSIRSNPAFHGPDSHNGMILIGNGTGMAGLRAHLKARALDGAEQNCLFFGERTEKHDFFYREEITHWQQSGHLSEVHLAFSQDQEQKCYVQDLVAEQSLLIQTWVEAGASIFVCGSLEGMASGVDLALQYIIGEDRLQQMKIDGTYARDVY